MKRLSTALSLSAALVLVVGLILTTAAATPGVAVYRVYASGTGAVPTAGPGSATTSTSTSSSFTVTEGISPGSNASFDTLLIAVTTSSWNASYSRSINSSLEVQPFLPSIANQSFTGTTDGLTFSANVFRNGSVPLTFQGQGYSLSSYAFSLKISYSVPADSNISRILSASESPVDNGTSINGTISLNGALYAFPSGLVYMVRANGQGTQSSSSVQVTLLSTTLPLSGAGTSATTQVASLGVGVGAVASALALGLGVRHKRQGQKATQAKPDHWVD